MKMNHPDQTIINFTPNGMIPTKKMTPYVPMSVNEIIEELHQAYEIGITMAHVHARDEKTSEPIYHAEVYGRIIEGIRKHTPDLILCVSLSGRNYKEFEKRSEPLYLSGSAKPDMGSLTLSSVNFNKIASVNEPDIIKKLALLMKEKNIKPELEAFDAGMINYAKYLSKKDLLSPPFYFNLILGNISCAQADLLHAGIMIRDLPERSFWSLGGVGDVQLSMNSVAISIGGGVRVGLEDNIWYDRGRTRKATNQELLKRIHDLIAIHGKVMMSSKELRGKLL